MLNFVFVLIQLQLVEQQLAAMNWKPCDLEIRIQELEREGQEKDQRIQQLEQQLDDQVVY